MIKALVKELNCEGILCSEFNRVKKPLSCLTHSITYGSKCIMRGVECSSGVQQGSLLNHCLLFPHYHTFASPRTPAALLSSLMNISTCRSFGTGASWLNKWILRSLKITPVSLVTKACVTCRKIL